MCFLKTLKPLDQIEFDFEAIHKAPTSSNKKMMVQEDLPFFFDQQLEDTPSFCQPVESPLLTNLMRMLILNSCQLNQLEEVLMHAYRKSRSARKTSRGPTKNSIKFKSQTILGLTNAPRRPTCPNNRNLWKLKIKHQTRFSTNYSELRPTDTSWS